MKNVDFTKMPKGFIRCYKTDCQCRENCLRAQATEYTHPTQKAFMVINPDVATGDADCKSFLSISPVRIAWGMRNMFDCVPHGKATILRNQLIKRFGYYRFYRMRRGEEPIYPEEQTQIVNLIKSYSDSTLPDFERYTEEVLWF